MQIGFKLVAEGYGPKELVRQAVLAEQAGFDFVEISDHFHPWLHSQGHSPFAWSVLAAAAVKTTKIGLATGVTCPSIRYHPAVIAQAAATTALLSDGRFTLGLGSGERLNEHVVGGGWPGVSVRQEKLRESIDVIRLLWSGGYHSYEGKYLSLDTARVFDLPEVPPDIVLAAGGPKAAALAAELADGLFGTEPKRELVDSYAAAGGGGPKYTEAPLAWAPDEDSAAASAHKIFRFGLTGWRLMAELPNPAHFEAATGWVKPEHLKEAVACGPDADKHVQAVRKFVDAGYDHVALLNAGPDVDGFFDFYANELAGPLRAFASA